MARTNSPDPAPHFVKTRSAAVNGTSAGCTRSGGRMYTAPAIGVGTEGTSTVKQPFFNSSTISAGTSASSISTSAGANAGSLRGLTERVMSGGYYKGFDLQRRSCASVFQSLWLACAPEEGLQKAIAPGIRIRQCDGESARRSGGSNRPGQACPITRLNRQLCAGYAEITDSYGVANRP
jgi:hypothetical protein